MLVEFYKNRNSVLSCVHQGLCTTIEDLGHVQLGEEGRPLVILQATDLHHFPAGATTFDVTAAKARVVQLEDGVLARDVDLLRTCIAQAKPDAVVLTGDIVDGRPFGHDGTATPSSWKAALREVLEPIVAAGCRWTFTPGNHDDDGSPWGRADLLSMFDPQSCWGEVGGAAGAADGWAARAAELCLSRGCTSWDHTLTVGPTMGPCASSSVRLWLFDSGGNDPDPALAYGTFSPAAVEGFRRLSGLPVLCEATGKAAQLAAPSALGIAFFHIPLPQQGGATPAIGHAGLFDAALNSGAVPSPFHLIPFVVRALGKDRVVGCSKRPDSGMFAAFAESAAAGGVRATFCGHGGVPASR